MTPTEQDKELREKLLNLRITVWKQANLNGQANLDHDSVDEILQLITADRKRVALEARIDELKNIMSHLVIYHGDKPARAVSTAKIRGRIAQLEQLTTNQKGENQ